MAVEAKRREGGVKHSVALRTKSLFSWMAHSGLRVKH